LASGDSDVIVWGFIHHKTQPGPNGFPDPNYFTNFNRELDNAGVPPADDLP